MNLGDDVKIKPSCNLGRIWSGNGKIRVVKLEGDSERVAELQRRRATCKWGKS